MRVLVTGHLGFIGSNFCRWLLRHDPSVHLVGFSRSSDQRYMARVRDLVNGTYEQRFQQIYGDLTDGQSLSGICEGIDYVVNFAAKTFVDHALKDADPFIQSNILGAHNLMDDATRYSVKRYVQVSTDEVYGQILTGKYCEDAPLNPRNPYAWSKACSDLDAIWRHRTYGFPCIVTRTENNFGPWQHRQKAIPTFVRCALDGEPLPVYGDGGHVRCWLYVEDHCSALWYLIQHGQTGEIYHIAGEQEMPNLELAKWILRLLDRPEDQIRFLEDHNVRPGHDRRYALDVSKLKATGWAPAHTLDEGMTTTVQWYATERWWLR